MSISKRLWRPFDLAACQIFGRKFVGGSSVKEVLERGAKLRAKGFEVTYNLLGEHVKDEKVVSEAVETTLGLIEAMDDVSRGNVSMKPTLYGLQISPELFRKNAENLVYSSRKAGIELEFDAERYEFIPDTFRVFNEFASQFSARRVVRQAVQAHLKDIVPLMDRYGLWDKQLRIVKGSGVYPEADTIVLRDSADILEQYVTILRANTLAGQIPYVATVRDRELAMRIAGMLPNRGKIVFEMLYGLLGRGLANELLDAGYPVRIYIPFVTDWCDDAWKAYGLRRAEMMRRLMWEEIKSKFKK